MLNLIYTFLIVAGIAVPSYIFGRMHEEYSKESVIKELKGQLEFKNSLLEKFTRENSKLRYDIKKVIGEIEAEIAKIPDKSVGKKGISRRLYKIVG